MTNAEFENAQALALQRLGPKPALEAVDSAINALLAAGAPADSDWEPLVNCRLRAAAGVRS